MEEDITEEIKDKLEEAKEFGENWNRYLSITTAIIAVLAAIASLESGNFSNSAILQKNNAILFQNKASDQWSFYQAKGIKKNLAEAFYQQGNNPKLKSDVDRYAKEQDEIKKQAEDFQKQVEQANSKSAEFYEKHHQTAIAVTFFQIAIALSAISALLKSKAFWAAAIILAVIGLRFFAIGII